MLDALIVGGDSQIGKALIVRLSKEGKTVVTTTRKWPPPVPDAYMPKDMWLAAEDLIPFDLRYQTYLPKAGITFFCTGINGFKPCEADPEEARRINVTLLTATARRIAAMGSRVVFLSSSAAETHPDTVYGTCKRDAEKVFLELGGACFRFGPVAFPGRNVYPNEVYSPINLSTLTDLLAGCFKRWEPGLHCIYNRDWVPEEAGAA
jgi:dTDP-4-dehydrorhamnose reductase